MAVTGCFQRSASSLFRRRHGVKDCVTKGLLVPLQQVSRCSFTSSSIGSNEAAVNQQQIRKMESYIDLLLLQNKTMNLTAIQSHEEAWERHVQDSLSLLPALEKCLHGNVKPASIIDIGSGAGLPGLIIAIARPDWQVLLLDSLQKRCKFVEQVVRHLQIDNADVLWSRAEAAGRDPKLREGFDMSIARAVAEMRTLVELSLPLVKVGGHLIAAKGPNPQAEVEAAKVAIKKIGGALVEVSPVASYGPLGQRTMVIIEKVSATPAAFPRDNGLPKKRPL